MFRSNEIEHRISRSARATALCAPTDCAQLDHHSEVVANRPSFGDAPVDESVHERYVTRVLTRRNIYTPKASAGPVPLARPVLDEQVAFRDDPSLDPATLGRLFPSAGR